jgi:hypothetical protein
MRLRSFSSPFFEVKFLSGYGLSGLLVLADWERGEVDGPTEDESKETLSLFLYINF